MSTWRYERYEGKNFFPEQKNEALKILQKCKFTKCETTEKVEEKLYIKFRDSEFKAAFKDYRSFIKWYCELITSQNGNCFYCGLNGNIAPYYRPVLKKLKTEYFEKGPKRKNCGERLEIDRKNSSAKYKKSNCVLSCYPCNNAKSNVFTSEEFAIIGSVIGGLKNKDKFEKMMKNKFIKGLINDVKKSTNKKLK